MKLYGIRNKETGLPLGISIFSNEGSEFCHPCGARFEFDCYEHVYMVPSVSSAREALEKDPKWYNASLTKPQWPTYFKPENWEVFSVNVSVVGE